ncbi:MAG: cadherin repeat domain-containing protein, partial [Gammaproteobacteria bacterium]|nr:cadherin repeat domain-containing protein [Gammaproteobacteria bacterium]
MAVTAETRTGIIALSVAMLGTAPGTTRLNDWVNRVDDGMSLTELANHIAGSNAFQAAYPSYLTNAEFAEAFLGNLMGSEAIPDALFDLAEIEVTGLLNGGMSRGELSLAAVHAMFQIHEQGDSHPAHGDLGGVAALLANRVAVAEYYTLDGGHEYPSADVLANVTSDAASVAMAIRDIKSPPADAVFDAVGALSIMENAASGDVGMVTASDPNDDADYPDPVSYSLKDAPAGFSIDAATGAISYMGDGLDHETTPTVDLTVVATSTGADGMPTGVEMMVTVNVGDVQESDAVFDAVGDLSIDENTASGTVGSVTATDAEGETVTYSLGGNAAEMGFSIDAATGAISYMGDGLDHETHATVDLEVIATSVGASNMPTDVS